MILPTAFIENSDNINAIIETPLGSRNKYAYNEESDLFELKKVLPSGTSFPLDFGFIPHTRGGDGDPLDVLVIMDYPAFPGCVLECRILGMLQAEQKEPGDKYIRNDRVIAVAGTSLCWSHLMDIYDINDNLLNEVVHFFDYYNKMEGKKFRLIGKKNRDSAIRQIKKTMDKNI
jgi:inorganic pyrophosphatase